MFLGAGTHMPAEWRLDGVSLLPGDAVRARGFVAEGYENASARFVETIWSSRPGVEIRRGEDSTFSLLLSGTRGATHALQTTTNLSAAPVWSTIWSGVISNTNPMIPWTNDGDASRFFRVVQP
jgi:hypothetical protein